MVLVKKKDGTSQFCADYCEVNTVTQKMPSYLLLLRGCKSNSQHFLFYFSKEFMIQMPVTKAHRLLCVRYKVMDRRE